jgi:ethanolamine utilization protein EutL
LNNRNIIKPKILSVQKIPYISEVMASEFNLPKEHISLGLLTVNSEHALMSALDEALKKSDAQVPFKASFYAGANYSSGPLSGEAMGIFSAIDPSIIDDALKFTVDYLNEHAFLESLDDNGKYVIFNHVIGSIGPFLSDYLSIEEGNAIAYLVAPPMEAIVALDHALKNSDTKLVKMLKPPTNTNLAGGYLVGTISDCISASDAFKEKIMDIIKNPLQGFS